MKNLSLLILVIFTIKINALGQVNQHRFFEKDNLKTRQLKGKVKFITQSANITDSCSLIRLEQCIKCNEGLGKSPKTELIGISTFKFDQNGRIIEKNGEFGSDYMCKIEYDNYGNKIEEISGLKENGTYEEKETCHYNDLGLWTELEEINLKKEYSRKIIAEYDDLGNLIEEKTYTRGSCEQIRTFKYDVRNKIIENKWFLNGELQSSVTYKYDNRGNLIESDGGNTDLETNKYNSNNKLIEKKEFSNGELLSTVTYKYDERDNIIEETSIEPITGNFFTSRTSKYDNRNKQVESSWCKRHFGGTTCGKTTYKYDIIGNIIEEKGFMDGVLTSYDSYKYDNRGNLIEENSNDYKHGINFVSTFKYDDNDNWIESKIFHSLDGKGKLEVYERKIEYYTE